MGDSVDVFNVCVRAYWYIFAAFMVLNVVDFFTGVEKAKYSNTENSNKGAKGVIKKLVIGL